MQEDCNRFELMFDDAQEYIEQKEKKIAKLREAAKKENIEIERKGECQNCGTKGYNRWVRDEFYVCYECFIYGLDCESSVMVPSRGPDQMEDYMEEYEWEERWENNE